MGNSCLTPPPKPPPKPPPSLRSSAAVVGPDWSELPEDLLLLVLHRLPSIPDLLRSSAVCTTWSSAFREFRRQRRPLLHQTLWLIVHETLCDGTAATKLYSLVDQRFSPVPFRSNSDPSFSKCIVGSSYGWLIVADKCSNLYLFNPTTGSLIRDLPRSATLGWILTFHEAGKLCGYQIIGVNGGNRRYKPDKLHLAFHKAVLSANPSDGGFAIVLVDNYSQTLAIARNGDRSWTTVVSGTSCKDIVFHKDVFYLVTSSGAVQAFNRNGDEWCPGFQVVPDGHMDYGHYHLAPCPSSGDLFKIRRFKVDPSSNMFTVYKITGSREENVDKMTLKNYTFFVSRNNSICLSSANFPKLRPSCIYFHETCYGGSLGIYDLQDGTIQYVSHADEVLKWLHPTWIIPSL